MVKTANQSNLEIDAGGRMLMMMPLMMIMARNQSNLQIGAPLINLPDPMDQSTISFKKRSGNIQNNKDGMRSVLNSCLKKHVSHSDRFAFENGSDYNLPGSPGYTLTRNCYAFGNL